ncbi:MAG: class I SAM-dependent methyltransferase [Candidatus Buchananbacteria bacterium]
MRKIYGGKNWSKLWSILEQNGNIGIDYCINPILYPQICNQLNKIKDAHVADFGAGTNILAIQFLFGYEENIPALKMCRHLEKARENIIRFTGLEQSLNLVKEAKKYHRDLVFSDKINIRKTLLVEGNGSPFKNQSLDLAVSRNFIMHLSIDDLIFHFDDVARVLKSGGRYIFAVLNPDYELHKYQETHSKILKNGERYAFMHGNNGENGTFYHHYKTLEQYEKIFNNNFKIVSKKPCLPITNDFKKTHARYYWKNCPMSFVYELQKI